MARIRNHGTTPHRTNWKRRITVVASVIFIVGVCVALRHYSGPQDVEASGRQEAQTQGTDRDGAVPDRGGRVTGSDSSAAETASQHLKIMASVNGQQITRQELARQCLRRYGESVLESMVNKHLIWQACRAEGISITDADVEAEIKRMAEKFGLSPSRWLALLRDERDITPEQYRQEIIWPTLALRALAAGDIVCTPTELREAYEAEYGPRVKVRAIMVSSRERAEELRARAAKNPDTFGALAKQYSEDPSASVHGLIPPIRKHVGDEQIERTAFALQEGEVSQVLHVANQYMVLKCEKHMPETYIAQRFRADAEARVRDRLQDQKLRRVSASLFQELQKDAEVVNVINDPKLSKEMPGVAATINGEKVPIEALAQNCIQRHGLEVLENEINRKILLQELHQNGLEVTEEDLDSEIASTAESYGYIKPDGSPDIEKWMGEVANEEDGKSAEFYIRDVIWPTVALKKLVDGRVKVTEKDIQKGFESNYGPRVEVLAIVLNSQRQAQKVWEMARGNATDEFFGQLAHQYSIEPVSRENFGRIPPIRRHGGRPELEREAFSLAPGELSAIIASGENYVILRCTGHTTPVVRSLDDEVRAELTKDIREKKVRLEMALEFARLQEAAAIENFLAGTFQSPEKPDEPRVATSPEKTSVN